MGVIKKKTGTRGTEGGIKYVCDVCSSDITSTVGSTAAPPPDYIVDVQCIGPHTLRRRHLP
jgi:transcriptional adapter 2-alpha